MHMADERSQEKQDEVKEEITRDEEVKIQTQAREQIFMVTY